jgi:hypothetical protein
VWRSLAVIVVLMWSIHFLLLNGLFAVRDWDNVVEMLPMRATDHAVGIVVSLLVVKIQAATARARLWHRFAATLLAAIVGCAVHSLLFFCLFMAIASGEPFALETKAFLLLASEWMWFYTSLSAMILSLSYSASLRARTEKLVEMGAQVHGAQVQALRYQLNPHFLFNTLNSIAALVGRKQHKAAEVMIENLSDFLRAGLATDPHEDVRLDREFLTLALYLDIEVQRFPGRLEVEIDLPPALGSALVPSLITQPLAESAIRRSAARSTIKVPLRIAARADGRLLRLTVWNGPGDSRSGQSDQADDALSAVEERLRARFGGDCSFEAGPDGSGGFRVALAFPLADQPKTAEAARLPARAAALH